MKIVILFIFFMISQSCFSQEIQATFELRSNDEYLKEGDLVEGVLRVWPIENAELAEFETLMLKDFFNTYKLVQIDSLALSENNQDVVELRGTFFIKNVQPSMEMKILYKLKEVIVSIKNKKILELKNKQDKFTILEQSVNPNNLLWPILIVIFLVLVVVFVFKNKIILKIKEIRNFEKNKKKKYYDSLFRAANSRKDYEDLYQIKSEWIKCLENVSPAHIEFFKVINSHQFKKHWDNEDVSEVSAAFELIRRSFEK